MLPSVFFHCGRGTAQLNALAVERRCADDEAAVRFEQALRDERNPLAGEMRQVQAKCAEQVR